MLWLLFTYILIGFPLALVGGKVAEYHSLRYRVGAFVCLYGSVVGFVLFCTWLTLRDTFGD